MRVAIFDNDHHFKEVFHETAFLQKENYKTITFLNESQGERYLGLVNDSLPMGGVDLFVINLDSKNFDAFAIVKKLRAHEDYFDVPILASYEKEKNITSLNTAFELGVYDILHKPYCEFEVKIRVTASLRLKKANDLWKEKEKELLETNRLLMAANQNYIQLTALDGLTGITNRATFEKILEMEWRRAKRNHVEMALLMIDVDYFKQYNDNYGHPAGDDTLRRIAHALEESISRGGDLVARYGGEEFIALLPNTGLRGARMVARLMMRNIRRLKIPHKYSGAGAFVTISIGGTNGIPTMEATPRDFVERADKMLYLAKRQGRAQVMFENI